MLKNILLVIIYALTYQVVHVDFLFRYFEYMGYRYNSFDIVLFIFTIGLILLPLVLIKRLTGFLEICFIFLYLLLYIPVQITTLNHYGSELDIIFYQLLFLFSFFIIFILPIHTRSTIQPLHESKVSSKILFSAGLVILLLLLYNFRNSFSIVSFENVYEHRSESKISSSVVSYLILWNTYLIGPLILIQGLLRQNKMLIGLGIISVVSVYGMTASKISLFIPLAVIGSFFLLRRKGSIFRKVIAGLSVIMIICYLISDQFFMLSAVFLMRTFGVSGLLTFQYATFFETHPHTFLSHVNFINYLTNWYSYNQPLGFEIGTFFVDKETYNANANFWATDGFAGFGAVGVFIISILLGLFLKLLKLVERAENVEVLSLLIIPFCFVILNVSFFTSILSGGFIFVALYYLLYRV